MNTSITLDSGRELEVEYDVLPASPATRWEPGCDEEIEIIRVSEGWLTAKTTEAEDVEILAQLWRELLDTRDADQMWLARNAED